jgi:hypothetical protein
MSTEDDQDAADTSGELPHDDPDSETLPGIHSAAVRSSYLQGAGRPPGHVQVLLSSNTVLEAPSSGQTVKISPLSAGSEFRRFHG